MLPSGNIDLMTIMFLGGAKAANFQVMSAEEVNKSLDCKMCELHESKVVYRDESYRIVGACFEVYWEKGCGFLEPVYQECLEIELRLQGVPYEPKKPQALEYKSHPLNSTYMPDFICYEKIVLELKAVTELADEHRAQVYNYLKATRLKLGLLVNFGYYPKAQVERIVAEHGRFAHDRQRP